jgi:hypothetical protein
MKVIRLSDKATPTDGRAILICSHPYKLLTYHSYDLSGRLCYPGEMIPANFPIIIRTLPLAKVHLYTNSYTHVHMLMVH